MTKLTKTPVSSMSRVHTTSAISAATDTATARPRITVHSSALTVSTTCPSRPRPDLFEYGVRTVIDLRRTFETVETPNSLAGMEGVEFSPPEYDR